MRSPAESAYAPPPARSPWRLEDLYGPSRLYGHGRRALAEALRLAGASGGAALFPAFVCRDLLSAAVAAGARPLFYPVGPDLAPAAPPSSWPEARAVVAVDYFGLPQDLAPFEEYARARGAVVIEDAAHALFSEDGAGRLLGTRAPLGILSPRKSLPLPNGGALLARAEFSGLLPPQEPFGPAGGARWALKSAARPLLAAAGARAALSALESLRDLRGRGRGGEEDPESESVLPAEPACLELSRPLRAADPDLERRRRRALWELCAGRARAAGLRPAVEALPAGACPYAYPLRELELPRARAAFAPLGLRVLPWPDLPAAVRADAPAHYRDLLLVHFLW